MIEEGLVSVSEDKKNEKTGCISGFCMMVREGEKVKEVKQERAQERTCSVNATKKGGLVICG